MSVAKRTASLIVLGTGVVLLFVALFVPWATLKEHTEDEFFGESVDSKLHYMLWELEVHSGGFSASLDYEDFDIFNFGEDSSDEPKGVGLLRAGGPMLATGLGLGALGAVLLLAGLFTSHGLSKAGAWVAVAAGAVAFVGTALFLIGMHSNAGWVKDESEGTIRGPYPNVGYFLAPLGAIALLVGGVLGFARARVVPGAVAGYGGYPSPTPLNAPASYGAVVAPARPAFPTASRPAFPPAAPAAPAGSRPGRCPKCKTAVTIVPGHITTCPNCRFSAA